MIKERVLQCRMSEIGRIKIGGLEDRVRRTSSGKEWQAPVKYEHFVVTTMERDKSGNFVKDEAIHSVIGDSPRELGIRLLYNDIELNFRTELAFYQGKTCLCRGDGEVAQRVDKETGEVTEVACPCSKMNEKMGCKPHGLLNCLLEQCTLCGGVHRFATTSWNTIKGIISSLKFISACTGGKIAGLPLKLKYTKKATITKDGQSTTIPVIMIVYDGNPVQMLEAAIQNEKQRIEAGIRMETLETTVRKELKQLTANTEVLDEEEVEEFHPLEEVKENGSNRNGYSKTGSKDKTKTIDDALKERTIIVVETPKPVDKPVENVDKTPKSVDETPKSVSKPIDNIKAESKTIEAPKSNAEPKKAAETSDKSLFTEAKPVTPKYSGDDRFAWYWCENIKCVDPISIDKNKTLNTEMCPLCHTHTLHEAKENSRAGAANERLKFIQANNKTASIATKTVDEPVKEESKTESVKPETAEPMTREEILRGIMKNRNSKHIMTDKFLELVKPLGVLSARAADWSDEIAIKIFEIMNNYKVA